MGFVWDRQQRLLVFGLCLLAFVPFVSSLGGLFVYDDQSLILFRTSIHNTHHLAQSFRESFLEGAGVTSFQFYRPLVTLSYQWDWFFWDGSPFGFHLSNLFLHAAVTGLVVHALFRWTRAWKLSLFGALLWAWHPTKVEAISWISGRPDIMCALGLLLGCFALFQRLVNAKKHWYVLEIAGWLLAFLSKELALVAPLLVWFELASLRRHSANESHGSRHGIWWPVAMITIGYVAFRFLWFPLSGQVSWGGFSGYIQKVLATTGGCFRLWVFPYPLSVLHWPQRALGHGWAMYPKYLLLLGSLVVGAMVFAAYRWSKSGNLTMRNAMLLGIALWLPTANVIPHGEVWLVSDRFLYLPSVAWVVLLLFAIEPHVLKIPSKFKIIGVTACLACFAMQGSFHTQHFLSNYALWAHERALDGTHPFPLRYFSRLHFQRGANQVAMEEAMLGYKNNPTYPEFPFRGIFGLTVVESWARQIPEGDQKSAEKVDEFYQQVLKAKQVASIETPVGLVEFDPLSADGIRLRTADASLWMQTFQWAGHMAAVMGDCPRAIRYTRAYLHSAIVGARQRVAATTLGRCGQWREAILAAQKTAMYSLADGQFPQKMKWAQWMLHQPEPATFSPLFPVRRAEAYVILGDWKAAEHELLRVRAKLANDEGVQLLLAKVLWKLGKQSQANAILNTWMGKEAAHYQELQWQNDNHL
jgi:hypothetical protein